MYRSALSTTPFFVILALAVAGCGSSASVTGDPAEIVGTWDYIVSDAADALNLRRGVIEITSENDQLGGVFSAPHIDTRPLLNVRYRNDELTFRIQAYPGQTSGVAFSLDPDGDVMTGAAFPDSSPGSVESGSRESGSRRSTNLRLTRTE